jgi:hypothetical protein
MDIMGFGARDAEWCNRSESLSCVDHMGFVFKANIEISFGG